MRILSGWQITCTNHLHKEFPEHRDPIDQAQGLFVNAQRAPVLQRVVHGILENVITMRGNPKREEMSSPSQADDGATKAAKGLALISLRQIDAVAQKQGLTRAEAERWLLEKLAKGYGQK